MPRLINIWAIFIIMESENLYWIYQMKLEKVMEDIFPYSFTTNCIHNLLLLQNITRQKTANNI